MSDVSQGFFFYTEKNNMQTLLNLDQMAIALNIKKLTLEALTFTGNIPHTYIDCQLRFNPHTVIQWMQTKPVINLNNDFLSGLCMQFSKLCPDTMKVFKTIDTNFSQHKNPKLYYLTKVKNKKFGFLYYVRYMRCGKMVGSRWCTGTNNQTAAELFAQNNRDRILAGYDAKRSPEYIKHNIYNTLSEYYKKNSEYLKDAAVRGRQITDEVRIGYHNFIVKVFIPFLREKGIQKVKDITPSVLAKFQTFLLRKKLNKYTINRYFSAIKAVFTHLVLDGMITENVFKQITPLRENKNIEKRSGGCYEIDLLNGIFNWKWREEIEYILNLLIYSTDVRNIEIENLKPEDIIKIKNCHFIDIKGREIHGELISKTENGVRLVPLHPFVYNKILEYVQKKKIPSDEFIFNNKNISKYYCKAKLILGKKLARKLGIKPADVESYLKKEAITFYSGRHYWKTLMSANGLGEVEEYFMGHKISNDVAKIYNHRDKTGRKALVKKAQEVFRILDKTLFKQTKKKPAAKKAAVRKQVKKTNKKTAA